MSGSIAVFYNYKPYVLLPIVVQAIPRAVNIALLHQSSILLDHLFYSIGYFGCTKFAACLLIVFYQIPDEERNEGNGEGNFPERVLPRPRGEVRKLQCERLRVEYGTKYYIEPPQQAKYE